jgi:hypothetical protein
MFTNWHKNSDQIPGEMIQAGGETLQYDILFPPLLGIINVGFDVTSTAVKLFLFLISYALCHEDIWGSGGIAPPFLTSAIDGGEWSASRPCHFIPGEGAPGT